MNKIEKIKKLADAMYNRMQNLTTDTSGIRKAMDEYHQFIINEYYKEDTEKDFGIKSNDLEEAATKYARKQVANPDYPTYNDEYELECAFEAGAQWQKEQDQSTIELAEDHAMLAGMEKMKQEIIDKAMVWLTSNMKWGVVSWDDKEECVRNFKDAMLLS